MVGRLTFGPLVVLLQNYLRPNTRCFRMVPKMVGWVPIWYCWDRLFHLWEHQLQRLGLSVCVLNTSAHRLASTFRDWDKVHLTDKPALPKEQVVPWASEHIISWIFSMIVISASQRTSPASVYVWISTLTLGDWTRKEAFLLNIGRCIALHQHLWYPTRNHQYNSICTVISISYRRSTSWWYTAYPWPSYPSLAQAISPLITSTHAASLSLWPTKRANRKPQG